ncbi:Leaf rust 10 disease-resistance locus receptor-like protein kinase [Melia azedarach]|uniref:Leaf rust 10 disease-resistance locus receptor-like protein kinase n=1 Tax=Melia azedarach TaxID=155640 RepID=A0ACC1XRT4_MELAZ|nr:Leaf rust 10 disease-resistance locus receptor-like protein kinase [Melia azedarach]
MSSTSTIFQISLLFFITNLLLSVLFPEYVYAYDGYDECSKSFRCGSFTNIGYPFWTNGQSEYCGHPAFKLDCEGDNVTIDITSQKYHVLNVSYEYQILKIARTDYRSSICPKSFVNITFNVTDFFNITVNDEYATLLYDCDPTEDQAHNKFSCPINDRVVDFYFTAPTLTGPEISARCNFSLLVPVLDIAIERLIDFSMTIEQVIKEGFEVKWNLDAEECFECTDSGGKCGYNRTLNDFTCFCPDQPYSTKCRKGPPYFASLCLMTGVYMFYQKSTKSKDMETMMAIASSPFF